MSLEVVALAVAAPSQHPPNCTRPNALSACRESIALAMTSPTSQVPALMNVVRCALPTHNAAPSHIATVNAGSNLGVHRAQSAMIVSLASYAQQAFALRKSQELTASDRTSPIKPLPLKMSAVTFAPRPLVVQHSHTAGGNATSRVAVRVRRHAAIATLAL